MTCSTAARESTIPRLCYLPASAIKTKASTPLHSTTTSKNPPLTHRHRLKSHNTTQRTSVRHGNGLYILLAAHRSPPIMSETRQPSISIIYSEYPLQHSVLLFTQSFQNRYRHGRHRKGIEKLQI